MLRCGRVAKFGIPPRSREFVRQPASRRRALTGSTTAEGDFGADRLADVDQDLVGKGEEAGSAVTAGLRALGVSDEPEQPSVRRPVSSPAVRGSSRKLSRTGRHLDEAGGHSFLGFVAPISILAAPSLAVFGT